MTQSWGALLIACEHDLIVRYASANLAAFIGCDATGALGQPLGRVLSQEAASAIAAGATTDLPCPAPGPGSAHAADGLQASCYRLNGLVYLRIEPAAGDDACGTWEEARKVVQALRDAPTLGALFSVAATELRRATGFDRALVYRFDPAGHGEVVAEDCGAVMEP
jgi:light-regulated signal transduction histidine kinase (bacteriophytochrome)